ncbi:MAG: hypothetical protein ACOYXC_10100 [Candidatus Rifleibacteriota bacterium]
MSRRILLILFVLSFLNVSLTAQTQQNRWELVGLINSPLDVFESLVSIEELKPVYEVWQKNSSSFPLPEDFVFPDREEVKNTWYFAAGGDSSGYSMRTHVWQKNSAGEIQYLGEDRNLIFFIERLFRKKNDMNDKKNAQLAPELPRLCRDLDHNSLFHGRFIGEHAAEIFLKALEDDAMADLKQQERICHENLRKMQRQLKKGKISGLPTELPVCPLSGSYQFDGENRRFVCSHQFPRPDFEKMKLSDIQKKAYEMVKFLQKLSVLEVKVPKSAENLVVNLELSSGDFEQIGQIMPFPVKLGWSGDYSAFNRLSPSASLHVIAFPEFKSLIENMRTGDEEFYGPDFGGLKPAEFMPEGAFQISVFGDLEPMFGEMPKIMVNAGLAKNRLEALKNAATSMGVQLKMSSDEIMGREVELAEIPSSRRRFGNEIERTDKIYVMPVADNRTALCVGEEAANEQIAIDCGEKPGQSLWDDLNGEMKLLLAYRAEGIGRAVLSFVNILAFENECRQCNNKLWEWQEKNRTLVEKLKAEDEVPAEAAALCSRGGIFINNGYDRLECSVHSFRNRSKIETQFFAAGIPGGRWLRFRVEKTEAGSRMVIDFKKAVEVR